MVVGFVGRGVRVGLVKIEFVVIHVLIDAHFLTKFAYSPKNGFS